AVVRAWDTAYGLAVLEVEGGRFTVPMREPVIGARHRLTIRAGDVSLAREAPRLSTVLNILPAQILSASAAGHEMVVVLGLGPDDPVNRILARVTRRSWDELQLA